MTWICALQVFRAYRECFEEQKLVMEQQFRQLLEESVQDAIHLSAENSRLKISAQSTEQGMCSYKLNVCIYIVTVFSIMQKWCCVKMPLPGLD